MQLDYQPSEKEFTHQTVLRSNTTYLFGFFRDILRLTEENGKYFILDLILGMAFLPGTISASDCLHPGSVRGISYIVKLLSRPVKIQRVPRLRSTSHFPVSRAFLTVPLSHHGTHGYFRVMFNSSPQFKSASEWPVGTNGSPHASGTPAGFHGPGLACDNLLSDGVSVGRGSWIWPVGSRSLPRMSMKKKSFPNSLSYHEITRLLNPL